MANLKEVRDRIKSVKSTQQITKAMKMVSAAKLRRAQDAIVSLRPYALKLNEMLVNILSNTDGEGVTSFSAERDVERVLIFVVTSNRGLAGAFNANIAKAAARLIEEDYPHLREKKGGITLAMIGKKGNDYLKRRFADLKIVTDYMDLFSDLSFDKISPVSDLIMQRFTEKKYDRVYVVYGKFKNAAQQIPVAEQYLPVQKLADESADVKTNADYIFEPNKNTLLEELVPSILQIQFQRFLLDTHASEHGARMTAMDKATENAEELVKDLKISYNKARQEAITKELSEIVGGAAALEG